MQKSSVEFVILSHWPPKLIGKSSSTDKENTEISRKPHYRIWQNFAQI